MSRDAGEEEMDRTTNVDATTTWPEFAESLYERLTGRGATIHYKLDDLIVEVPRSTGPDAPRAVWRFHGTVSISTEEPGG